MSPKILRILLTTSLKRGLSYQQIKTFSGTWTNPRGSASSTPRRTPRTAWGSPTSSRLKGRRTFWTQMHVIKFWIGATRIVSWEYKMCGKCIIMELATKLHDSQLNKIKIFSVRMYIHAFLYFLHFCKLSSLKCIIYIHFHFWRWNLQKWRKV